MTRLIVLALAAVLAVSVAHAAPMLRPAVTVSSPVIRIGDLFDGAGAHAHDPVAAAPAAGMRITFGADWLAAMAQAHQLDWTPNSPYDQVTVVRASRIIDANTITQQLMSAIAQSRPVDGAELRLDNPDLHLVVPAGTSDALAIDGLVVEPGSLRVSAVVSAPPGNPAATRQRVTGQLVYRVEIPVLSHPMGPGATIAADDLEMVKMRRDRIPQDTASEMTQLIGRTPRRPLPAEQPIQLGDVERPVLVHRGDLVTLVLETPSLQLTAQGKALDDGAQDALVRVENTKSNRVIDAAVAGPGLVAVKMAGAATLPSLISSR
ncbi:MAG TPA: flagellar basal body P-ring formation chaperone FlgA [Stellaceae bacterium]|nr:flagellar basal body P-ring formation chaperone FlgA [Stellaceae bacterium]